MGKLILRSSLVLTVLFIFSIRPFAQENSFVKTGTIKTFLTISPAFMLTEDLSSFYFHGNLEGYLNERISIAGDGFYHLGELNQRNPVFDFNHSVFFGAVYHFIIRNSDFHMGIQPGMSITRVSQGPHDHFKNDLGFNPLLSSVLGYNLYVHKIFHFFIQTRLIFGEHNFNVHHSLADIRLSAGLGFNF